MRPRLHSRTKSRGDALSLKCAEMSPITATGNWYVTNSLQDLAGHPRLQFKEAVTRALRRDHDQPRAVR
ncbi:MAG TPA: hypothetical protein VGS58_07835 [Candidatus Sulfopaludibacter sp.]|nr:hypothetical protein [Candidatus Sulfopaludibacter sp.]